jgi:glycerol uptake facilitator-like aquaporin
LTQTDILTAFVGFAAAMFFCKGTVSLSNRAIFDLAGTYWNFNRPLADALALQRAEYIAGATLLFISFAAQLAANLLPPDSPSASFQSIPWAVACLVVALIVLLALALTLRAVLIRRSRQYLVKELDDTMGGIMRDAPRR